MFALVLGWLFNSDDAKMVLQKELIEVKIQEEHAIQNHSEIPG
jgi:hypothetical protein